MLGGGRPLADRRDVPTYFGWQPVDVMGIPWIVPDNAAAPGIGLEGRTKQKEAAQQSTKCRHPKSRYALQLVQGPASVRPPATSSA
ncbi:hypothetical protein HMPREF9695_04397 [Afipia broomeae ATCC 49717]|uniref:Uncharacterized protein n=1 Tax=Afipia broomeae ATCC 49717 TaxID=883078 RepID=K8NVX5_9BRAD|nr:hypothetical protein HMPREF9695_04397 [Afipia broomeae ATCC 49717]